MTTGEGGIVLTNDAAVADRARMVINHGMKVRYTHDEVGYNYRMTNIAGAIGLEQLKRLDGFNEARRRHAAILDAGIANPHIETPYVLSGAEHVYHQYTVKVKDGLREKLIAHLEKHGVGYGVFYPFTIPEQPAYKELAFRTVWPAADEVKGQVLSLPVHPGLTEEEVQTVAKVVSSFE